MLKIGSEVLYTKTELLDNIRTHIATKGVGDEGQAVFAACLATALQEDVDYIFGAIRKRELP